MQPYFIRIFVLSLLIAAAGCQEDAAPNPQDNTNSAAQTNSSTPIAPELTGSWEGPLVKGRDEYKLAFTFNMTSGTPSATFFSTAMGMYGLPVDSIALQGNEVIMRLNRLDAQFSGSLIRGSSGQEVIRIDGDWFQESELVPVTLIAVPKPSD